MPVHVCLALLLQISDSLVYNGENLWHKRLLLWSSWEAKKEKREARASEPLQGHSNKSFSQATRPRGPTSLVAGTSFQPVVLWETVRLLILPKVRGKWLWWVWDFYFLPFLTFLFVFSLKSRVLALEAQITRWQNTLRWGCGYQLGNVLCLACGGDLMGEIYQAFMTYM